MVRLRGRLRGLRESARAYRTRRREVQYWKLQERIAGKKQDVARAKAQHQLRVLKMRERRLKGQRISPKTRRLLKRMAREFI